MKIIIPSQKDEVNSEVSEVFGRAPFFLLFEIKDNQYKLIETIKNTNANTKGGVGAMAAKTIAEKKAKILIAKNIGPHAKDVLNQFDIKIIEAKNKIIESINDLMKK